MQVPTMVLLRVRHKAVADAAHGLEIFRCSGVVFDIAAEAHDEVIDSAGVGVFADVPYLIEEFLA